jgi:lysozyme family protein
MGVFKNILKPKNNENNLPVKEPIVPDFKALFLDARLDEDKVELCKGIIARNWMPNKSRYTFVSKMTSIPAWIVFCIHYKEASCNFTGCLHNGDKIIGTGEKTRQVPKGRGPFETWEESAIDALLMHKKGTISDLLYIPQNLEFCERYNGLGHRNKGELSPYVWAYTTQHDETGNYVADGKYKADAPIKSAGVVALLLAMESLKEIELSSSRLFIKEKI